MLGAKIAHKKVTIDNGDGTTTKMKLGDMDIALCHDENLKVGSPWCAVSGNTVIFGEYGSKVFFPQSRQAVMALFRRMHEREATRGLFSGHNYNV